MIKKCLIQKYDVSVKEPPYEFIDLGNFTIDEPDNRDGFEFIKILKQKCREKGFEFRFYSLTEMKKYDYIVTVFGEMEQDPNFY